MLNNFLKKKWNPLFFRILATIGFIFAIMVLYFGSLKFIFNFDSSFIMLVLWVLWWPFLYVTLFFLGRFWCGFLCPIGLSNEIGNAMRKTKKNYLARYIWIPFVLFFLIVLWEQVSGLFSSFRITLIFLFTFFISAYVVGMLLPRWGFCKYFCPIGTLLGVFSRLSILGIRTDKEKCWDCETRECIRGGRETPCPMFNYVPDLKSNKDCLLCLNCIKNCPHNSAKLCFVKPGEEINKKIGFSVVESLFIIALLGFEVLLTSKGTQLFRIFNVSGSWVRALDFSLAIGLFMLGYFVLTFIYSKLTRSSFEYNFKIGGYVFLPLVFALMFFLVVFGFVTPLTNINELWIALSKYVVLLIGVVWSGKIAWNFFRKKSLVYLIVIFLIGLFWVLVLIPGPLNLTPEYSDVYSVEFDEVVQMRAFSMGLSPNVIKVKSGGYFDINISNKDIVHAFDIDELNIHVILNGGESKKIRVNTVGLEPGRYEYYCAIPGHREAGMKGVLIVEDV